MSLNLNQVTLAGHLTRDPEVKTLAGNKTVANFGLATNRRWKKADGTIAEETTFVDIDAWGKTAENAGKYLTKGSPVHIDGRLKLESWEKDGVKHSKLKVVAETINFLSTKKPAQPQEAAPADTLPTVAGKDDEPPF